MGTLRTLFSGLDCLQSRKGRRVTKAPLSSEQKQGDLFDADPQPKTPSQLKKPKENKVERPQIPVTPSRFLSIEEVAARYSVGHSTIWRWAKTDNRFPAPIKLSPGTSRWSEMKLLEFEAGAAITTPAKPTKTCEGQKRPATKGSAS